MINTLDRIDEVATVKDKVMLDEQTLGLIESVLIDGYDKYALRLINHIECVHTKAAAHKLYMKYVKP